MFVSWWCRYTSLMDGAGANDASVLNVLGRLHHDNRSFQVAGDLYTKVRPHSQPFISSEERGRW